MSLVKRVCLNCGSNFSTDSSYIAQRERSGMYCCRGCFFEHRKKQTKQRLEKSGYLCLSRERVHRIVMERLIGRKLDRTEVVHHKNGNRADNRIENLEIMSSSEHTRLHFAEKSKPCLFPDCGVLTISRYELCPRHYLKLYKKHLDFAISYDKNRQAWLNEYKSK